MGDKMSGDAHQEKPEEAAGEHGDGHGHGHSPHLAHHFDSLQQQFEAGKLGMWLFLATEVLLFGGLFCFYAVYKLEKNRRHYGVQTSCETVSGVQIYEYISQIMMP